MCYYSPMNFPIDPSKIPSAAPKRRMGVVAQALLEKLEKLRVVRRNLDREQAMQLAAAKQLELRIAEVESELAELATALDDYEIPSTPVSVESESDRWAKEQTRFMQAEDRTLAPAELYPPSSHQKQAVITEVRLMLEKMGSMHVRDIHKVLRASGIGTPNVPRLSQILSESEEFQADRSKGWSLKGEKPGFGRPGFSESTSTSSGDESKR